MNKIRLVKGGFEKPRCVQACPIGIDVPRYLRAIRKGDLDGAASVVREKTPFVSVLGYVCPRYCENRCRRAEVDEAVAVNALKRFIAERGQHLMESAQPSVSNTSGKRVAIVGSGPAGLTASYYLARLYRHKVTVFEAHAKPGGMMQGGIPEYRLPREAVDKEIRLIEKSGVEIKTNSPVQDLDFLFKEGFNAVLLAVGTWRSVRLGIEGENLTGVVDGISFLKGLNYGGQPSVGKRVVVIGGGNVAIDAARSAKRLGAAEVTMVYRRTRDEMPARLDEVDRALEEGIRMLFLVAPSRIVRDKAGLHVEFARMQLVGVDESGRRRPLPISGSHMKIDCDTVIVAIGEEPDITSSMGVVLTKDRLVKVDRETLSTGKPWVFATGDCVTGPSSVVEAIAGGKRAATSIHRYLTSDRKKMDEVTPYQQEIIDEMWEEDLLDIPRQRMPLLPIAERVTNFNLVELGFTKDMAAVEAARCLRCDECLTVHFEPAKCIQCFLCQTICSFTYSQACNPESSRLVMDRGTRRIHFDGTCIAGCALCINYCATEAISLGDRTRPRNFCP